MAMKAASVSLLREVADAVERLGEPRVRHLLQDALAGGRQGQLPLKRAVNPKRNTAIRKSSPVRSALIEQALHDLKTFESREGGVKRIRDAAFSRRELESLARMVDVPIRKDQKVQDLEELIVNVTIGGRLNSKAIRDGS